MRYLWNESAKIYILKRIFLSAMCAPGFAQVVSLQGKFRWAMAARNKAKLEGVRSELANVNQDVKVSVSCGNGMASRHFVVHESECIPLHVTAVATFEYSLHPEPLMTRAEYPIADCGHKGPSRGGCSRQASQGGDCMRGAIRPNRHPCCGCLRAAGHALCGHHRCAVLCLPPYGTFPGQSAAARASGNLLDKKGMLK